jgi:hypothetical protein
MALLTNIKLASDKHVSLFCLTFSDKEKKVYEIDTWAISCRPFEMMACNQHNESVNGQAIDI